MVSVTMYTIFEDNVQKTWNGDVLSVGRDAVRNGDAVKTVEDGDDNDFGYASVYEYI